MHVFQFTHPGKGATCQKRTYRNRQTFQFTHPGKGATGAEYLLTAILRAFQFTHPGKGATHVGRYSKLFDDSFNSRTLGRVRLLLTLPKVSQRQFQFTHPGKGATEFRAHYVIAPGVSIHAPWEGCDRLILRLQKPVRSFNSRTLGRVRHDV